MKTPTTLAGELRALHKAAGPHFCSEGAPPLYAIIGTAAEFGALTDAADQLEALAVDPFDVGDPAASPVDIDATVRTALGEPDPRTSADALGGGPVPLQPGETLQPFDSFLTEAAPTPITAPDVLRRAEGHIAARASTYDRPEGERSAGAAAAAFNAITGRTHQRAITEAEAWLFLQCLKQVRLFQREGWHADSAEDNVAYGALLAEAKAREGEALFERRRAEPIQAPPCEVTLMKPHQTIAATGYGSDELLESFRRMSERDAAAFRERFGKQGGGRG